MVLVTELVVVVDEVNREAFKFEVGLLAFVVEVDRMEEDVTVRGVAFCVRVARPITGGETGVDVVCLAEELAGLSQEEKKSSSSLAALASVDEVISGMPSIWIRVGNLLPTLDPGCHKERVTVGSPGDIFLHSFRKLFFVQLGNSTGVLLSCIRVPQEDRSTMLCEEIRGRSVTPDLHCTELVELPAVQIGGSLENSVKIIVGQFRKLT